MYNLYYMFGYPWLLMVTRCGCVFKDQRSKAFSTRRNFPLLLLGDLSMESKDLPTDHHHFHLLFVDGAIFYEHDGVLSCGKNWSVFVEDNVLCVVRFRSWQVN